MPDITPPVPPAHQTGVDDPRCPMREYGSWRDADGRMVPLQLGGRDPATATRLLWIPAWIPGWARGWRNLFVGPAGAAMAIAGLLLYGLAWAGFVAVVMVAVSAGQIGALLYALNTTASPSARRNTYRATSAVMWVVADLAITAVVVIAWLSDSGIVLRIAVVTMVLGTALDVKTAKETRRWRPWLIRVARRS